MINVVIQKSSSPKKKYEAVFNNHTVIPFGANGYEDFTTHKDEKRKQNYIKRHSANEDWTRNNLQSAAWLSRWILWEKPTIQQAITHANKMYQGVKFILK